MTNGPRIAIVYYSMYGHIRQLAQNVKKGIEAAGGQADVFQIAETLPAEVLEKMHAPPKSDDPIITVDDLTKYDAFVFGIPTRFGTMPAQWRAFWDQTGALWATGGLVGKYFSAFVSTATPGGGQETTILTSLPNFIHHGMIYVPLGFSVQPQQANMEEVRGSTPWGAGTFASTTGARQPSQLEIEIAEGQGKHFYNMVSRVNF